MHHRNPVAQRQHLVEVIGDQQHRRAGVAGGHQLLLQIGDGADVKAPGGLVRHDQLRRPAVGRKQGAAQDQLLHVAARERPRLCQRPTAAHVEGLEDALRMRPRGAPPYDQGARKIGAQPLGHCVFPHRQVTDHPGVVPVFRDSRDAPRHQPRRVGAQRPIEKSDVAAARC